MKSLKILLLLVSICVTQSLNAQIKTLKGENLSSTAIDKFIQQQMDSLKIPALSIAFIKNNKIVYYKATGVRNAEHGRVDNNTIFEAASMTKTVFAYAVLKLVKERVLSLDTPLYKYYPYDDISSDERYKLITARMVLDHSTGFPNWRENNKLTINFTPGSKFGYSGEAFEYLGQVVKHLTGKNTDELIKEYVFNPLSIKNSYLTYTEYVKKHLTDGLKDNKTWGKNDLYLQPYVSYSLYTDAKDYAKFVIQLMKESDTANSTFQSMSAPQLELDTAEMKTKVSACLGIFAEQTPYGVKYFHPGNNDDRFTSIFEFYKDSKIGVVYFMNCIKQNELTKRLNEFLVSGK